ncbi:MAG: hypothetical protein FK730_07880 [Asgard group archaeon]|nr:hypothetical protein [Asgard group archaeon]
MYRLPFVLTTLLFLFWNERCFLNPPYSRGSVVKFVTKAYEQITENPKCELIVALLPVRTSTQWFQEWVYPFTNIFFLPKRLKH